MSVAVKIAIVVLLSAGCLYLLRLFVTWAMVWLFFRPRGKRSNVSVCGWCYCMTRTVRGKCGKCGAPKAE